MRAGKLRSRVTIQGQSNAQNEYGEMDPDRPWTTFTEVYAEITPISGRERVEQRQGVATMTHEIRIRYTAGVTHRHRVLFGSRIFHVHEVRNVEERDREMILTCSEVLA